MATIFVDIKKLKTAKGMEMRDGTPIHSFRVRESDGRDEAAARAAALATAPNDPGAHTVELMRLCLVEVNGQKVEQPYLDLDNWKSKPRNLLGATWKKLNVITDQEENDFLGAMEVSDDSPVVEKPKAG